MVVVVVVEEVEEVYEDMMQLDEDSGIEDGTGNPMLF